MRNATLALTIFFVLAAGQLRAAAPRAPKPDVGPGRVAWFDITRGGAVGLALDPVGHPIGLSSRTPMPSPPTPAK